MLKIKSDLEKLIDFGFKTYNFYDYYYNNKVRVNKGSRTIRIVAKGSPYDIDVIYDLIKADLVEKV